MTAPQRGRHLLGVFRNRAAAESAADRARAGGADDEQVHVGRPQDSIASLRAEMRAELEDSWVSPQAAFVVTKEAAKGSAVAILVLTLVGGLLGVVLAFIFSFGLALWLRLVLFGAVGAIAGATVGFIFGASAAEKGAQKRLAAERGVTVRVEGTAPEVEAAMSQDNPIRLDVVSADGTPTGTVITTEEEQTGEGVVQDLERAVREPERERPDQHEDPKAERTP